MHFIVTGCSLLSVTIGNRNPTYVC